VRLFLIPRILTILPLLAGMLTAQELVPRAYVITPVRSNAITISTAFSSGDLAFDPSVPIEGAKGRFAVPVLSAFHSFGLFGRSANVVVAMPYAVGNFHGVAAGTFTDVYRSGLVDSRVRFAINLKGGPAMRLEEYVKWKERTLIGASVNLVVPTGQNDPARVVNPGTNRWAIKSEVAVARRRDRWVLEGYAGVWWFGANHSFFPGNAVRTQRPMTAFETHLGYYLRPRLWASLDGNFWIGGRSAVNGVEKQDLQTSSRVGATVSVPVNRHQSFKFSYNQGAYVSVGGNFKTISAAWQYSWITRPK
jgi:hypothetical protein